MFIDYFTQYKQIQNLVHEKNAQKRGYKFEQLIRETLPWSSRPPISSIGTSEQHDAYFTWEGRDYLVEAKAKQGEIQRGSHDWEDFELKVSKRLGQIHGIFASLYEVSPEIYQAANEMSFRGVYVVIVDGTVWEKLFEYKIGFDKYIEYVIRSLKLKNKFEPSYVPRIKEYFQDIVQARGSLMQKTRPVSAQFLRRHKHDLHEKTYVSRSSDEMIRLRCMAFKPSNLNATKKKRKNDGTSFSAYRAPESQIILLRDVSGAGKTTLAVQLALNQSSQTVAICRTASDPLIDNILDELLSLGGDYGLDHLVTIDGTLLYVIDSLDEAEYLPGSRKAVISLNKTLITLNKFAENHGLARFPIVFIYTLREEHWRNWESVFEGADVQHHKNRFSFFDNTELERAIQNYSSAYGYSFVRRLTKAEVEAVRSPFDLFVFSETFSHEGEIDPGVIFSQSVLANYFQRKEENIALRPLPGISAERVVGLVALLATRLTRSGDFSFDREAAYVVFQGEPDIAAENYDRVINMCLSENILIRSENSPSKIRFRHNRFIEYLVAIHFCSRLKGREVLVVVEELIKSAEENPLISVISICDIFRTLSKIRYPERFGEISSYFAKSVPLLKSIAQSNRLKVARGSASTEEDLVILNKGLNIGDPDLAWEVFFVSIAKNNLPTLDVSKKLFQHCWDLNSSRSDSWKLIKKLDGKELLTSEIVVKSVLYARQPAIWLAYLDVVIHNDALREFADICLELDFVATASRLVQDAPLSDWKRVEWALSYLARGLPYPLGAGDIQATCDQ